MAQVREWTYDGTELAWLQERLGRPVTGPGHVVSELVPSGFEAYLRVFHRFEATDGSGRTRKWRTWAEAAGIDFHPELSHLSLPDRHGAGGEPVWTTEAGDLDGRSRGALARCLADVTGDQDVCFAYDLAALCWGEAEPLVRRASMAGLEAVREEAADRVGSAGPEFWWPRDRSWVVTTDYDLLSTYVGCSQETAERILGEDELEALPVTPQTRVDWYADRPQHRG
ncbi:hypothetical protein PV721_09470 [Streptomyces sp. MB09-01]|uniref:hypothetical protein n=1 Tax=Streptomyces sp. MB09-01 TaxID=3028666 RepID=UPI0029B5447A|nr:hypothetical protein [Streptomyces sp. MB09-01]MDX3534595.1 hypothetical protein [Streptomyces sp. MB09-01]